MPRTHTHKMNWDGMIHKKKVRKTKLTLLDLLDIRRKKDEYKKCQVN